MQKSSYSIFHANCTSTSFILYSLRNYNLCIKIIILIIINKSLDSETLPTKINSFISPIDKPPIGFFPFLLLPVWLALSLSWKEEEILVTTEMISDGGFRHQIITAAIRLLLHSKATLLHKTSISSQFTKSLISKTTTLKTLVCKTPQPKTNRVVISIIPIIHTINFSPWNLARAVAELLKAAWVGQVNPLLIVLLLVSIFRTLYPSTKLNIHL